MQDQIQDFSLYLQSEGRSKRTVEIYVSAAVWLARTQEITDWREITKTHVRKHMVMLNAKYSPAYASNQYRALRIFFQFLRAEEGIDNPMLSIRPPKIPQKLVPVLEEDEFPAVMRACAGNRFVDVRDRAMFSFFHSSGARRAEVAGLRVSDIDLEQLAAIVTGKGNKMRIVRFDASTGLALSRYLRRRAKHRHAGSGMLWLGGKGALLPHAINLVMKRRAVKAGLRLNPHRFRHDFSHRWLLKGGEEGDLMSQNGWSSSAMLKVYGASAAAERARAHYDQIMR